MSAGSRRGEDGFVLVSFVMVLAAVSAILTTVILQSRGNAALARTRANLANLQGMADGVARLIAYDLAVGRTYRLAGLGLPEDGTVIVCQLEVGRALLLSLE